MGLFLLVFCTVSLGIVAGYQALSALLFPDVHRLRKRIAEEFGTDRAQAAPSFLFKNPEQLTLDAAPMPQDSQVEAPPEIPPPAGMRGRLQALLERANLPVTVGQLLLFVAGAALVAGIATTLFAGLIVGTLALAAGAVAPLLYVGFRANARQEKYLRQLPNAFDLMARVIRAGQSVPQALQAVAEAFEDPLAAEFADCQKQQALGLRPEVTFQRMAQRSGILEMRIFAMAMLIQRQTGGNLSEVLERLAGLVRARLRQRQQVRTLTAEGRLQGWTLLVLPIVVFAAMMVIHREYAEVLFEHPVLLIGTGVSMALGMWWIRKIVNFDS